MSTVNNSSCDEWISEHLDGGSSPVPNWLTEDKQDLSDGNEDVPSSLFSVRDRCWLCQCLRKEHDDDESEEDDCFTRSKDGALHEFLPWLCKSCEKTMEEEERKAEPGALTDSEETSYGISDTLCLCESCSRAREMEVEQEKLSKDLEQFWMELCEIIQHVYHASLDSCQYDARNELHTSNIDRLKDIVSKLCAHDADQLFQRLERQIREVVIEMKVKLLKELTVDLKVIPRAVQFMTLLLNEYQQFCLASQQSSLFLTGLEVQHLHQFQLSWQLHNKHLFHSVIYSDPVVQNCLPKVIGHLRNSLLSEDPTECRTQCDKTLADFRHFESEMCAVGETWKECKRLIEQYNEEQAALRLKQKMFKEDWAFFKSQRRLLEQAVPKSRTVSSKLQCCNFDVHFKEMMKKMLQGKKAESYDCPSCKQHRCPCDECNISHMITCGIISSEVCDELPAHHHNTCRHNCANGPTHRSSPPPLPPPLSFPCDPLRYYSNVKPPSMPSSSSSSHSESPVVLDRCQCFDDNFGFLENADSESEYIADGNVLTDSAHKCTLAVTLASQVHHSSSDTKSNNDIEISESSPLKQVQPSSSSLIARMMMASVNLSADKMCSCPHCLSNNGTLCMFENTQHSLVEPKPDIDQLQSSHFGMSHRLLNPQLYELHDGLSQMPDEDVNDYCASDTVQTDVLDTFGMPSIWSATTTNVVWPDSQQSSNCNDNKVIKLDGEDLQLELSNPILNTSCGPFSVCQGYQNASQTSMQSASDSGDVCNLLQHNVDIHAADVDTSILSSDLNSSLSVPSISAANYSDMTLCTTSSLEKTSFAVMHQVPCDDNNATRCVTVTTQAMSISAPVQSHTSCQAHANKVQSRQSHSLSCRANSNVTVKENAAVSLSSAKSQSSTACKALALPTGSPKLSKSVNNESAVKQFTDAVGQSKLHCQGDETSENMPPADNKTMRPAVGAQKDGRFCECWHCEFFGHVPSSLPLSRNYAEMRDRLRLRLQKRKERSSQFGVSNLEQPPVDSAQVDHLTPPPMLNDKEVEEIIRFINGVDETVTASQTKQKAKKSRKIHVKDGSKLMRHSSEKLVMNDEGSNIRHELISEVDSCKNKRQKLPEKHVDTATLDDIFLPSDEVSHTEVDDFDHEIEEFKRFCYNSCLMQKRDRQRVTLNLKDIFVRKKLHQGCNS